jgi:hypothetical protein
MKISTARLSIEGDSIEELKHLITLYNDHRELFSGPQKAAEEGDTEVEDPGSEEERKLSDYYFSKLKKGFRRTKPQIKAGVTRLQALQEWHQQYIVDNPDENKPGQWEAV